MCRSPTLGRRAVAGTSAVADRGSMLMTRGVGGARRRRAELARTLLVGSRRRGDVGLCPRAIAGRTAAPIGRSAGCLGGCGGQRKGLHDGRCPQAAGQQSPDLESVAAAHPFTLTPRSDDRYLFHLHPPAMHGYTMLLLQ